MFRKKEPKVTDKSKKEGGKPKKVKEKKAPRSRSEEYIFRKNLLMRILRIALWIMLIFIFIRGVATCTKKDSAQQAQTIISNFRQEFADYKDDNEEIMGFAQNFIWEYTTYDKKADNYAQRIKPYVSKDIYNKAGDLMDFSDKATTLYAKAYRKESYTEKQQDVYVMADILYEHEEVIEKNGEKLESITQNRKTVTFKVPVYAEKGRYVVEGLPVIVNDSMALQNYSTPVYTGKTITDSRAATIKEAVSNFLEAYYGQDQNVIEYYLAKGADRTKFKGLSGAYRFDKIESISCYEEAEGILCIVEFKIADGENSGKLMQALNLFIVQDGDKYYIKDMNTKTGHLTD